MKLCLRLVMLVTLFMLGKVYPGWSELKAQHTTTPLIRPNSDQGNRLPENRWTQHFAEIWIPSIVYSLANFPFMAAKFDHLATQPFSFSPRRVARGFPVSMMTLTPAIAAMSTTNQLLSDEDDGPLKLIGVGLATGVASSMIDAPAEWFITQQRRYKRSFRELGSEIWQTRRFHAIGRGFTPVIIRDMTAGAAMFTLPPLLQQLIPSLEDPTFGEELSLYAISGLLGGVVTQPFDVIRGEMQRVPLLSKGTNIWAAGKFIYKKEKLAGLFRGTILRSTQFMAALSAFHVTSQVIQIRLHNPPQAVASNSRKAAEANLALKIKVRRRQRLMEKRL